MTLLELLNKANEEYEGGFLSEYYDENTAEKKEGSGDTLAEFIVIELTETFDAEADDSDQIQTAVDAIEMAMRDLHSVINGLSQN